MLDATRLAPENSVQIGPGAAVPPASTVWQIRQRLNTAFPASGSAAAQGVAAKAMLPRTRIAAVRRIRFEVAAAAGTLSVPATPRTKPLRLWRIAIIALRFRVASSGPSVRKRRISSVVFL